MYRDVEDFLITCPGKYEIVLSDHTLAEIEKIVHYTPESTIKFFINLDIKCEIVETSKNDVAMAKELNKKGSHFSDALHAAIALNKNCQFILTFNKKDFTFVENNISVVEPADLT